MQNILQSLIDDYGNEKVVQAAEQLLETELRKRAGSYHKLVTPEHITDVLSYLDSAVTDVIEAGQAVDEAYANRRDLVRQISQLETSIELTEAEAFMRLEGNKVEVDGKTITLSNDKMRDMYRKYVSREDRKLLAELEAELKAIEIDVFKAKDRWEEAKQAADLIKSRAYVQANLLQFLS